MYRSSLRSTLVALAAGALLLLVSWGTAHADTWTVLGYIAADNNLENYALNNIIEMQKVGSTGNVKVIIQLDRGLKHTTNAIPGIANFAGTKRLRVDPGGITELQDMGDPDGTLPQTIAEFISWGIQNYPADHYAIIFWDHGGGWQGCCQDENGPGRHWTPLNDIAQGVKDGLAGAGRQKVDLIGFDECLMASVEVAHAMQPYADVMVASEETEPGEGWDYEAFLSAITTNPSIDAAGLGRAIADGYAANVGSKSHDPKFTLAVIDLTKVPALVTAIDALSDVAVPIASSGSTWQKVGKPRGDADGYGREGQKDPFGAIDLGMFCSGLASGHPDAATAAGTVKSALAQTILYKVQGPAHASSNGMSIYLPEREVISIYRNLSFATASRWSSFLDTYIKGADSDTTAPDIAPPTTQQSGADTTWQSSTTDSAGVQQSTFVLASDAGNGNQAFVGELPAPVGSDGKMTADFDGKWPLMVDGNDQDQVPFFVVDTYDDQGKKMAMLAAIAEVSPDATGYVPAILLFAYDIAARSGRFAGAYEEGDDGANEINMTAAGAKVRPMSVVVTQSGDYTVSSGTKEFAVATLALEARALPDGKYQAGFSATDYAGNTSSRIAPVTVSGNPTSSSGGGCGIAGAPRSTGAAALALALGLAALGLRRRRARR